MTQTFTITPRGPFSLYESATFGFGQRLAPTWDGVMRMAFCLDGYRTQVGVELRQDDAGVHGVLHTGPDVEVDVDAAAAQVARVLSLDHDGTVFGEIGERDPVIGRLQQAAPGLRPPQFYSPYEGAAWAVLSARRPATQMARVREALSLAHGTTFELAGQRLAALPTPERLLEVSEFQGIPPVKLQRLHGVARAALDGRLDVARIVSMDPGQAMLEVRKLDGIGPFYSALVVVRASGLADVPVEEPKAMELAGRLYGLGRPPTSTEFARMAQAWRPLRTWAVVLIRAAGNRVLAPVG